MSQHIVFLLLGLGNGAVFAALAIALVVTYRSSGVVNFATGAIALYIAYTYAFLREGQFLVPIPGLPVTVDLGGPLSFWPAFMVSLVVAAVFGLLLYFIVFRPLRSAPPSPRPWLRSASPWSCRQCSPSAWARRQSSWIRSCRREP